MYLAVVLVFSLLRCN